MEKEVPKYKKKAVGKQNKKADHKHEYAECILANADGGAIRATYCTVCLKIYDRVLLEQLDSKGMRGFGRLALKAMQERYPKLPVFVVTSLFNMKYVSRRC